MSGGTGTVDRHDKTPEYAKIKDGKEIALLLMICQISKFITIRLN
jgi:hypothetical protein